MLRQQWHVVRLVCLITLRQTFWSKKTIGMVLLAYLPVVTVLLQRFLGNLGTQEMLRFFPEMLVFFYIVFVGMLFALFYGSAVAADEIENRTLTYLVIRPVPKSTILIGKYIAYLVGSSALVLPSLLIMFFIVHTHPRMLSYLTEGLKQLPGYLLVVFMTLVAYGAVYLLFGVRFKRPVLYGLLFFGWEKIVLALSGVLRKLSVVHYLLSVFPDQNLSRQLETMRADHVGPWTAWITLIGITLAFVVLAIVAFTNREYRMTEQ